MKVELFVVATFVAALFNFAAAEEKKLQIGVKHRPAECTIKSRKNDVLHMHYTVRFTCLIICFYFIYCFVYEYIFTFQLLNRELLKKVAKNSIAVLTAIKNLALLLDLDK